MMTSIKTTSINIEKLSENIFNYSIDRSEMHHMIDQFSSTFESNRPTIEYEIQILRIIGVGWSISYFVHDKPFKEALSKLYWNHVREFSANLSSISSAAMSKNVNYFSVIKERMDLYLTEFHRHNKAEEPIELIGPKFAELCSQPNDALLTWLGSKMFQSVLNHIKIYLSNVRFEKDDNLTTPSKTKSIE